MHKTLTTLIICLFFGAAAPAYAGYQTKVSVSPSTEPNEFVVAFKISQTKKNDQTKAVSEPLLIVKKNLKGQIKIDDRKSGLIIHCTALINATKSGMEATTTVIINENGIEKLNTSQSLTTGNIPD